MCGNAFLLEEVCLGCAVYEANRRDFEEYFGLLDQMRTAADEVIRAHYGPGRTPAESEILSRAFSAIRKSFLRYGGPIADDPLLSEGWRRYMRNTSPVRRGGRPRRYDKQTFRQIVDNVESRVVEARLKIATAIKTSPPAQREYVRTREAGRQSDRFLRFSPRNIDRGKDKIRDLLLDTRKRPRGVATRLVALLTGRSASTIRQYTLQIDKNSDT